MSQSRSRFESSNRSSITIFGVTRSRPARKRPRQDIIGLTSLEPFWKEWAKLTPAQRLRRCWRRRRQLRDPIAAHDSRSDQHICSPIIN